MENQMLKVMNKPLHVASATTWARTYILLSLVVCIAVMFCMAAAGYYIAEEHTPMAVISTLGVLITIGLAFIALDHINDCRDFRDLLKKPFGYSWKQWGLMCSGLAVAIAAGPFLVAADQDEDKNRLMRVAGGSIAK